MNHEQQHEMLVEILGKLIDVLSADELSLVAYHLGIKISEFYPVSDADLFNEQERLAA
ncbi:MAG: hypothetical protein WBK19_10380 [Azonexus sp.]